MSKRSVDSAHPVVCFLYLLMHDHLPAGVVSELADRASTMDLRFSDLFLLAVAKRVARSIVDQGELDAQELLSDLRASAADLRDSALTVKDWPADTVLGESGVQAIDAVVSAYERLDSRLSSYESRATAPRSDDGGTS